MASSESLRQTGNTYFAEFKKCSSEDGKKLNLHKAVSYYSDAMKAAQSQKSHEDIKSVAKNLFLSYHYLYDVEMQASTKEYCLNEGMKFASVSIFHHRSITPSRSAAGDDKWLESILEKLNDHISKMWQYADKLSENAKVKFIYVFGNKFHNTDSSDAESAIITQFRKDQTDITITHGMQYVLDKDYTKGLHLIHEGYFPLQETLRLRKGISDEDIKILEEEYRSFKSLGEALKMYNEAMGFLEQALNSEEELQMEIVWNALDNFRQSTILSKGESVEFLCMAQSKIGEIYYKILKNETKAKSCCQECITLAQTLQKNNYEDDWYVLATAILKEIQQKFQEKEDQQWQKQRQKYLDELKEEIKDLDSKSSTGDKEFMTYLSEKFPATKHKPTFNQMMKKILKETNDKRALQKVITLYHPDKVSSDEHSMTYFVLCEEISKRLTARYQVHKG